MTSSSMARAVFEQRYAERSGVALEDLYRVGIRAYPCRCDQEGCLGWQMISREQAEIQVHLGLMTPEEVAEGVEPAT